MDKLIFEPNDIEEDAKSKIRNDFFQDLVDHGDAIFSLKGKLYYSFTIPNEDREKMISRYLSYEDFMELKKNDRFINFRIVNSTVEKK